MSKPYFKEFVRKDDAIAHARQMNNLHQRMHGHGGVFHVVPGVDEETHVVMDKDSAEDLGLGSTLPV